MPALYTPLRDGSNDCQRAHTRFMAPMKSYTYRWKVAPDAIELWLSVWGVRLPMRRSKKESQNMFSRLLDRCLVGTLFLASSVAVPGCMEAGDPEGDEADF